MSNIQRYQDKDALSVPAKSTLPVDHVTGLPRDVFPGQYTDKERGMIMAICDRYGFDPLLKEVELLHGQIFVTAKGIARVATNNPTFNGIEVEIIHQDWTKGKEFFVVKARVWKKGFDHPIEDIADSDGSKMKGGNLFRHTITRAKARAMRTAFAIPFCSTEELADEDQQPQPAQKQQPVQQQLPPAQEQEDDVARQMRRLHAVAAKLNITHEQLRAIAGVESLKDLSATELHQLADEIGAWLADDADLALAFVESQNIEELSRLWMQLPPDQKRVLARAKDAMKRRLLEAA